MRNKLLTFAAVGKGTMLAQTVQRAMIEVDEEGAEAAAATAAMATRSLEADDSLHMIVDKPFVFALRDRESGAILVAGYVGQPPVAATTKRGEAAAVPCGRDGRSIARSGTWRRRL